MALHRDIEEPGSGRAQPVERLAGRLERRDATACRDLASGTLACPSCDVPVLPAPWGMAPSDSLSCAWCNHSGAVRDFLSLAEPTRPTHVVVQVRGFALT